MRRSRIAGMGFYVPENVVTNDDLAKLFTTSDEWIQQRTGIKERRYAADDEGAADMALVATNRCLQDAGKSAEDIDFIILATLSPDHNFPAASQFLQGYLDIPPTPAVDIHAQCTGFLYGLTLADQCIRTGLYDNVLVIGAENHSTGLEFSDRGRAVTVIFGDGAGAVLLTAADEGDSHLIMNSHLYAEGKYAKKLWLEYPASKYRPRLTKEAMDEGRHYPQMEGRPVFNHAITRMPEVITEALETAGYTLEDLDVLILHQANLRINQFVAHKLGLPPEKMFNNIDRYGNTTAATIPICLCEAREAGLLKDGALVCFSAFGAGFTWGAVLLRW
jgi:3-oxoacyl-[acyl-carrier-protein] synthase-3